MESRWFLLPGQTPQNTKISDRKKALHITSDAWENITAHLDKKRRNEEAVQRERAKKKAMKDESQAMVDEWPNSVLVRVGLCIQNLSKAVLSRICSAAKRRNVLKT